MEKETTTVQKKNRKRRQIMLMHSEMENIKKPKGESVTMPIEKRKSYKQRSTSIALPPETPKIQTERKLDFSLHKVKAEEKKEDQTNFPEKKKHFLPYYSDSSDKESESEDHMTFTKENNSSKECTGLPQVLLDKIDSVCLDLDPSAIITQASDNWRDILVLGPNVSSFQSQLNQLKKELEETHPEFSHFNFWVQNTDDLIKQVSQSLSIYVKVPKQNSCEWKVEKQATCELLVSSRVVRNQENPHEHGAIFAVVPGHLILSSNQFKRAKEADDTWRWNNNIVRVEPEQEAQPEPVASIQCDHHGGSNEENGDGQDEEKKVEPEARISRIREEIMASSSKTEYFLKVSEKTHSIVPKRTQDELRTLIPADIKLPPLVGCRQKYFQPQSEDIKCPAGLCSQLQDGTCHHMFLNDIALLPIEYNDAERLQTLLATIQGSAGENIYKIKSLNHLEELYKVSHPVVIQNEYKSLSGMLKVAHRPSGRERVKDGKHLSFIITSETDEGNDLLEDGDCGRIVYLQFKTRSGEERLKPVGMYVSKIDIPLTDRTEPHYQAVILSQAFQDLQDSYPYHIGKIRKFRLQEI